jgi:hypothetical protein
MHHNTKALVLVGLTLCFLVAMQTAAVAAPVGSDAYEPDAPTSRRHR